MYFPNEWTWLMTARETVITYISRLYYEVTSI